MTAAEHYREAERIIGRLTEEARKPFKKSAELAAFDASAAWMIPVAQVHATLAHAALTWHNVASDDPGVTS